MVFETGFCFVALAVLLAYHCYIVQAGLEVTSILLSQPPCRGSTPYCQPILVLFLFSFLHFALNAIMLSFHFIYVLLKGSLLESAFGDTAAA